MMIGLRHFLASPTCDMRPCLKKLKQLPPQQKPEKKSLSAFCQTDFDNGRLKVGKHVGHVF